MIEAIPRIIHTYWHNKTLPNIIKACINSWKMTNPDFEIRIYDHHTFKKEFPNIPHGYETLAHCHKSDYVRLTVLEKYGGYWIDASVILTGSLSDFYRNINRVNGFSAQWGDTFLENWFIIAPPNDPLIKQWRNEYINAIKMGFNEYRINYLSFIKGLPKDTRDIANNVVGQLPYLTQHACYMRMHIKTNMSAKLLKSIDGPFRYQHLHSWNTNNICNSMFNDRYVHKDFISPIIKLIRFERNKLIRKLKNGDNINNESVIGRYILPFYKKVVIIRTHDPTNAMVDRIIDTYDKSYDRNVIVSIHLSSNSFNKYPNTDIFGDDYNNKVIESSDDLDKNLIDLVKNGVTKYVEYQGKFYPKIPHSNKVQTRSSYRTLNIMKPNIERLIDIFDSENVHFYTDHNLYAKYGKFNLKRWNDNSVAWNHHNECIALTLIEKDMYNFDNVWVLEDDIHYTGNIIDFIHEHERMEFDLIGSRYHIQDSLIGTFSPKYVSSIWRNHKQKYSEHIICMSGRFIREMFKLLEQGYNGHSEVTTPSYCHYLNMIYVNIDPKYIGKQYDWKENMPRNKIERLVQQDTRNGRKVFIHPCKF